MSYFGKPKSEVETVLLIHGTFANRRRGGDTDWWHPGSEFCRHVDASLHRAGSAARCWAHLGHDRPFAWTGENSERARR